MIADRRLLILIVCLWTAPLAAQELKPFVSGSYAEIVRGQTGTPLVLAFWSVECPPCYAELRMLGELRQKRAFDLVLVTTDPPGAAPEARRVLARFGLEGADAWLFAGAAERLRFEVDRTWYGELPRSYLFSGGARTTIAGRLEAARLERWLRGEAAAR